MYKPLPLILVVVALGGSSASAMPVAPLASTQSTLTIQVGSGCGLGVHRGAFYDCPPYCAYRGYDYDPYDGGYARGYSRGYRRGFHRGYSTGRYDAYPYWRLLRRQRRTGGVLPVRFVCILHLRTVLAGLLLTACAAWSQRPGAKYCPLSGGRGRFRSGCH